MRIADQKRPLRNSDSDVFWRHSAPPHFHALYAEHEAQIDIRTLEMVEGSLPDRALALVLEWAARSRAGLVEDWQLCETMQPLKKVQPLE